MKIRINTEAKFRWKLLMEGKEVDWAYYDLIVEITKPSHSKEIIDMTIDGSTLVFSYKPNQCGQYIATAYLNRYKPDEAALDVKIFEGVRWSWCADNDDDEITTFNLSGNLTYSSVNLNNYYTKQEIDDKLEDIAVGDIDLTSYATKTWVSNKYQPKGDYQPAGNYLTSIPDEYITETELEKRLEQIDIPDTDLSDYYTKGEVDDKIDNIDIPTVDLTAYATKSWTTANYQPKGDYQPKGNYQPAGNYLTSIPSEYITETELTNKGYATKAWTKSNYQPKGDYQPKGNYLTSIPSEYITETDLNDKSYVTENELTNKGYATKTWITANYQPKGNYLTSIPSEYVTETELSNKSYITLSWATANYQPKGDYQPKGNYLTSIPSEYVTETELNDKGYLTSVPSEYITETELNDKGYLTSVPSEYVTETELNGLLGTKVESSEITNIKQLTEEEYNALTTVDNKTIYIIVE